MPGIEALLLNTFKGAERVSEHLPSFFSDWFFSQITAYGHRHMPFGNDRLNPLEKLAVRDSFFRNPEFKNASINFKRAASRAILDFATTSVIERTRFRQEYGFEAPTHMVISPTERCNYKCVGCYAKDYTKNELTEEEFQRAINQGKGAGMHFFVITGGEPFMYGRKKEEHGYPLLNIFRENQDCLFLVYTNGSFLAEDGDLCAELGKLGNVMPGISVEGNKEMTDWRRGNGAYDKDVTAWKNLTEAGVLHGFSIMTTSRNIDYAVSEEFAQEMKQAHCAFGFYFTYIPEGSEPDLSLMIPPKQDCGKSFLFPFYGRNIILQHLISGTMDGLLQTSKGMPALRAEGITFMFWLMAVLNPVFLSISGTANQNITLKTLSLG